ncbi:MAG: glycosyltransferase family 2 protein [Chloroflexia bacterium]|nr:glycosyltransferase family 2 protein [Chloroflexia bacterium]
MSFDLSIVIVNWNGGQVLLDCLESIYARTHSFGLEVIVVDNASSDGSPERAAADYTQVRLLRSEHNLGFAGGNNLGLEAARGRYLLLLNNDTVVLEDALEAMLAEIESRPEVGILGCRLLNPDGSLQRSCGMFPSLLTEFLDQTMLHRLFPTYKIGRWDYNSARPVDWVTGACLLVRRKTYEQIGGLDEGYFMFLEDVDWCQKAWRAGWQVFYTPAAEIVHLKGHSSRPVLPRLLVVDQASGYRFFRRHHGRGQVWALRLIVSLGCLVRGAFWALRRLLGQREEAAGRLRAYGEILRRTWLDRAFVWGETHERRH